MYRSQWSSISPYNTVVLSGDRQFTLRGKTVSGGAVFLHDRSNDGLLRTTQFYIGGAYRFYFDNHKINVGLQPGIINQNLGGGLSFGDQFDLYTGVFNSDLTTDEIAYKENTYAFDLNAGIKYQLINNMFEPSVGIAFFHLLSTPQGFIEPGSFNTPLRMVVHGSANVSVTDAVYITPNLIYMNQNKAENMVYGLTGTYILDNSYMEKSVFFGVYTRNEFKNFDALIFLAGVNWFNWTAGISYDVNMSPLTGASRSPGGFEISLIYKEFTSQIQKIFIPCERF